MVLAPAQLSRHHDKTDRGLLAILTDPIVGLFRSIPIEILEQSDELNQSQKEFLEEIHLETVVELMTDQNNYQEKKLIEVTIQEEDDDEEEDPAQVLDDILNVVSQKNIYEQVDNQVDSLDDVHSLMESILEQVIEQEDANDILHVPDISTTCCFIRSQSHARVKAVLPDLFHICTLPPVSATFCAPPPVKKTVKRKKSTKMAAEVLQQNEPHCFIASSSSIDRPFKLLVQKETFLIDAESMSRISPIFNVMCFGKDFEKMDLSREIVDEKSNDIDCFLRAVHDTSMINSSNFALVLRLSNKYQVDPVIEACQNFIMRQHLDVLRADEILTMLIAAHEHHCKKEVVQKLIKRLASEGNSVFTKLKISRYLPAQVYGSVISTSMNLTQIKEHEAMNGHVLKMERSKIRWRQSVCEECKSVAECANCEECKKTVCRKHVNEKKCSNDYGSKLAADLKKKVVDFEWQD